MAKDRSSGWDKPWDGPVDNPERIRKIEQIFENPAGISSGDPGYSRIAAIRAGNVDKLWFKYIGGLYNACEINELDIYQLLWTTWGFHNLILLFTPARISTLSALPAIRLWLVDKLLTEYGASG